MWVITKETDRFCCSSYPKSNISKWKRDTMILNVSVTNYFCFVLFRHKHQSGKLFTEKKYQENFFCKRHNILYNWSANNEHAFCMPVCLNCLLLQKEFYDSFSDLARNLCRDSHYHYSRLLRPKLQNGSKQAWKWALSQNTFWLQKLWNVNAI